MGALDVERGVADGDRLVGADLVAVDQARALEGDPGHLAALVGVRAVAAEGEEAVQLRPVQLDVGGGFGVAGDEPDQVALVDQPRQQLLDAGQDPVAVGLLDRLVEVVEAPLHQPGELLALGLAVQHRFEGLPPDLRVGHAGVGELADVGRDVVELVEREAPRGGAGAAGGDQRAVDVEEDCEAIFGHRPAEPNRAAVAEVKERARIVTRPPS